MTRTLALAAAAALFGLAPAFAQKSGGITGGGIPPASGGAGDRSGAVTATGQTKPPGTPVGDNMGTRPDLERKSRQLDRQIKDGICKGC